jgi:hypothetical protein
MNSSPRVRFLSPPVLCFENCGLRLPARHPTEGTSQADYSGLNLCFQQCSPKVSGAIGEIGVPSVPVCRARLLQENPAGCAAHLRSQNEQTTINSRSQFQEEKGDCRSRPANSFPNSTTTSNSPPRYFSGQASNMTFGPARHRRIRTRGSLASTSSSRCDRSEARDRRTEGLTGSPDRQHGRGEPVHFFPGGFSDAPRLRAAE